MPNYLHLEPDELRRIAEQHAAAAEHVRKWGEIPWDWLNDFQRTFGTIADPVWGALKDYYRRRYDRAERQAENHERTRDNLLLAAQAMEEADRNSGGIVTGAGDFEGVTPRSGGSPATGTDVAPPMMQSGIPAPVPPMGSAGGTQSSTAPTENGSRAVSSTGPVSAVPAAPQSTGYSSASRVPISVPPARNSSGSPQLEASAPPRPTRGAPAVAPAPPPPPRALRGGLGVGPPPRGPPGWGGGAGSPRAGATRNCSVLVAPKSAPWMHWNIPCFAGLR
uniref:type VII secretion target n=1 Tax=Nocardia carnea TaxID=37328 RepID=UPI003D7BE711